MGLVVVADDLTGASDAGVQFAQRGFCTTVWLDAAAALDAIDAHAADAEVMVVDMNSRAASRDDAYARMRAFLARLRPVRARAIVKKMDSTLRGNTGAELRALLESLPNAFAIVCPEYPAQGRTCVDGVVYVHGTRVDHTDFARDIVSPVRDARVGSRLESPYRPLSLADVRSGTPALNANLEQALALHPTIRTVTADAETDEDLRALASLHHVRDDIVWVGSAGLLEALADEMLAHETLGDETHPNNTLPRAHRLQKRPQPQCRPELVEGCATIAIVGSMNEMTRRQIAAFAAHPEHHVETLAPTALLHNHASVADAVARAATAIARGAATMLALTADDTGAALAHGHAYGWDARETSRRIREALAAAADSLVETNRGIGTVVVLSGGDVARSFCERQGIRGLELLAEIAPGIPLSRVIGANLMLVTKAGGFGHAETYHTIATALRTKAFM